MASTGSALGRTRDGYEQLRNDEAENDHGYYTLSDFMNDSKEEILMFFGKYCSCCLSPLGFDKNERVIQLTDDNEVFPHGNAGTHSRNKDNRNMSNEDTVTSKTRNRGRSEASLNAVDVLFQGISEYRKRQNDFGHGDQLNITYNGNQFNPLINRNSENDSDNQIYNKNFKSIENNLRFQGVISDVANNIEQYSNNNNGRFNFSKGNDSFDYGNPDGNNGGRSLYNLTNDSLNNLFYTTEDIINDRMHNMDHPKKSISKGIMNKLNQITNNIVTYWNSENDSRIRLPTGGPEDGSTGGVNGATGSTYTNSNNSNNGIINRASETSSNPVSSIGAIIQEGKKAMLGAANNHLQIGRYRDGYDDIDAMSMRTTHRNHNDDSDDDEEADTSIPEPIGTAFHHGSEGMPTESLFKDKDVNNSHGATFDSLEVSSQQSGSVENAKSADNVSNYTDNSFIFGSNSVDDDATVVSDNYIDRLDLLQERDNKSDADDV
ncbi:hypothetical protein BVG19_g1769 [[Candida] boidinii]|nr:hypothetical protein BVG19_g1769 [[Candida] boidinii]OWB48784.1 hypothetical protein B5S27_g319 [[Candida] boidinii]